MNLLHKYFSCCCVVNKSSLFMFEIFAINLWINSVNNQLSVLSEVPVCREFDELLHKNSLLIWSRMMSLYECPRQKILEKFVFNLVRASRQRKYSFFLFHINGTGYFRTWWTLALLVINVDTYLFLACSYLFCHPQDTGICVFC